MNKCLFCHTAQNGVTALMGVGYAQPPKTNITKALLDAGADVNATANVSVLRTRDTAGKSVINEW